jgi:hypothetical protein
VIRSPPIVPGIEGRQGFAEWGPDKDSELASAQNSGRFPLHAGLVLRAAKIIIRTSTCAALLALLLWLAIYNGQPLFSPDTSAYIRGFDGGMVWLIGRTTEWTTWASELPSGRGAANDRAPEGTSFQSPGFIIAGRSVSYGALLYLGELLGKLWASVARTLEAVWDAIGQLLPAFIPKECANYHWIRLNLNSSRSSVLNQKFVAF